MRQEEWRVREGDREKVCTYLLVAMVTMVVVVVMSPVSPPVKVPICISGVAEVH